MLTYEQRVEARWPPETMEYYKRRNAEIYLMRDNGKRTFKELGLLYDLSPNRTRQICVKEERRRNRIKGESIGQTT